MKRTIHSIKIVAVVFISFATAKAYSQAEHSIPSARRIAHEEINKVQKTILRAFRLQDSLYNLQKNEESNIKWTNAIIKTNDIQNSIDTDSSLDEDKKMKFLKGLKDALDAFLYATRIKELTPDQLPILIDAFYMAMNLDLKDSSILPVIQENDFRIGQIIARGLPFQNNRDINKSKELVVLKAWQKEPAHILPVLFYNPNVSFADSLLEIAARTQPEELYIFAQAKNTPLGIQIHKCDDPLVKIIADLANRNEGRLYFPFLGNLVTKRITMTEISKTFGEKNKADYYKLLVKTQIDYVEHLKRNDTAIGLNSLMDMLKKKAVSDYINVINELHDEPDAIRLKVLQPLNSLDLYYLCITGEDELYTSSYLKIYNLIFHDRQLTSGYALLQTVHFDHFKRFIKMASNFNTLDDFLTRMDKEKADSLMRSFVNGMEGPGGLEDAVDVADSYSSIPGIRLRSLILGEVQKNLTRLTKSKNKTGSTIYGLLNTVFLSLDSSKNIDIFSSLGIPPVYKLNNSALQGPTGKIIIQQFFYGDKDGKHEFSNFIRAYHNSNWKITSKDDWIEVQSVKGAKVVIYSNKPLDDDTYLDSKAQETLGKYLDENKLHPSIVIHRGHSYFIQSTISLLAPSAKLVLLGSCGGYNNLSQVIKTCPYVQIIATKQQGSGTINQPMIVYLTELLREGKDLNWPGIWKVLKEKFKDNKRFEDYIPPDRNLGAIFIMAYNTAMGIIY